MIRFAKLVIIAFGVFGARAALSDTNNAVMNEPDHHTTPLTVMDQSGKQKDLSTTSAIRQALVKDRKLSADAQNIKIITRDGKVVLRGLVKTAGEKQSVEKTARQIAGSQNVTSQLTLKNNTTNQ